MRPALPVTANYCSEGKARAAMVEEARISRGIFPPSDTLSQATLLAVSHLVLTAPPVPPVRSFIWLGGS